MFFKNFKNKLLVILFMSTIIMPNHVFAYSNNVVLGGENIGINVTSPGVMIVGFYNVDGASPGKISNLRMGDIITKVDDTAIYKITDLSKKTSNKTSLKITYKRNGKINKTTLKLKKENGIYKTGLYVKNSITGIGTLTFIDPSTKRYGALGHEIIEQHAGVKFEIKEGKIFDSKVTGIEKADRGTVGEKDAILDEKKVYGTIDKNDETGIYGDYTKALKDNTIEIGDAVVGNASIVTTLNDNTKTEYDINILSINKSSNTKNILFEVTDKDLLKIGGGIVQGMSGSPIIQNNKLVGAVTHVVVDDPHKGYGIIITNMLKESEKE